MSYRGSKPPHVELCRPEEIVPLEARNGLLQFDAVRAWARATFGAANPYRLEIGTLLELHRLATQDIYADAGHFRDGPVSISGTEHEPPPHAEVPAHVDGMIAYINDNWSAKPVHLCAYLMWRCNWIHPFFDGNGRTTRALSYLIFLIRLGYEPGGTPTFVDMIADDKSPYYSALDDADAAWKQSRLDVSSMETLVGTLLARQLVSIVTDAGA